MAFFICSIIPQELVKQNDVSQAAVLFCRKIVDINYFDKVISLIPVTILKKERMLDQYDKVYYIQSRFFKHVSIGRYFNVLIETFIAFKTCILGNNFWFYNISNQNMLLYILLKYVLFKKVFVLLADFTPPSSSISLPALIQFLISHSDGILSLSERSIFYHHNFASLPGIIDSSKIHIESSRTIVKTSFLFSGYLGYVTGVDLALEYFSKHSQFSLYVTGRGDLESKVEKYAAKFSNIIYLGFLEYDDYINWLCKIDICLNFRNPQFAENNNNFPSKVLEYFTYGKIVISTIDYPEILGLNYFYIDYSEDSIDKLMYRISELSDSELIDYTSHSNVLKKKFSDQAWINTFLKIENGMLMK